MGSVFDFPPGVDLATAVPAEALFRASGLSRRASLVLAGLGLKTLGALRSASWSVIDSGSLYRQLQRAAHCGPAVIDEIERWRAISAEN